MKFLTRAVAAVLILTGWGLALWLWTDVGKVETLHPHQQAADMLVAALQKDGAALGIAVLGQDGELLASHQSHIGLLPASTLKALTAGLALHQPGAGFQFSTVAGGTVPLRNGTIEGNLVIRGSGDPSLRIADLRELARRLVELGLAHVQGDIIADASAYPENPASDHWNHGDVGNAYGAGVSGINVEVNRYVVRFHPGAQEGDAAELADVSIPLPGVEWWNSVLTGPAGSGDGVVIYGGPYSPLIQLRGTVPAGEPGFAVNGAIPDPPLLAATILHDALVKAGVQIAGRPTTNRLTTHFDIAEVLVEHRSAPLTELVRYFLATSDNVFAQSIFLQSGGRGGFLEYFETRGINLRQMRIEDGSGLARANTIPAAAMAACLRAANADSGGALRELLTSSMDGRRGSKGGAMSGVRADVGFLTTMDGEELTYAVIANSLPAGLDFWQPHGEFLRALHGKAPQPDESN